MIVSIDPHPLLDSVLLHTVWPKPLGQIPTLTDLDTWFSIGTESPLPSQYDVKLKVRNLLRHGGFKPSGRSKPASEYLIGAVEKERMSSINAAVDCCNVASLHSGLPISVVDTERGTGPWRIGIAESGVEYVFNPTGQIINIGGLVVLFDKDGPCGGPVKDSQRTKTHPDTLETLSIVWGTHDLEEHSRNTADWYSELLRQCGAQVTEITPTTQVDPHG